MKHKNSISQINIDRDREVIYLYQKAKRLVEWPTTTAKICDYVSQMPAPCYYLSFDTAYRYVCRRLKGEIPKFGKFQQKKQSLCEAFFCEFQNVRLQRQGAELSTYRLVEITLEQPAPHLGIAPRYIQKLVSAHFKKMKSPIITKH